MNNDLISRDYVSKKICDLYSDGEKANKKDRTINEVMDIVDNAPTVFNCNACKNMGNERECVDCHDYSNYVHYDERPQSEIIKAYTKGFDTGVETVKNERPQGEPVIKCQDCKYRVKEWREDNRMKEKGYWVYGCKHFGEIMGYWGFGGNDNEFCSDAEQKGGA